MFIERMASTQEPEPEVCVKNGTPASWGGTCRVIVTRTRVQRYCENIYFLQEKTISPNGYIAASLYIDM